MTNTTKPKTDDTKPKRVPSARELRRTREKLLRGKRNRRNARHG